MRRAMTTTEADMRQTSWFKRLLGPVQAPTNGAAAVRYAAPDDVDALLRLAELDSSRPPRGLVLVAEVGDELWAAVSVDDDHAVADPFRPTGELVLHLHDRARRVRRAECGRIEALPRVWPAARVG
jgi:hypothetical protein